MAVGLMDLAAETRVAIYGWVFNTFCREVPHWEISTFDICCPYGNAASPKKNERLYLHPTVCNGVPTELVRVSKKIHNEALPVMWENVHFIARFEPSRAATHLGYTTFADLFKNPELASHIRSLTITATVDDVLVEPKPHQGDSNMQILCAIVQRRLPMLAELRLHIDTEPSEYGSTVPYRSEIELLAPLVRHTDAPVVFIGLHALLELPWTWSPLPFGLEEELEAWVNESVMFLGEQATKEKKRIEFKPWR
ncbi:hypothetical protein LTR85_010498 [Meristemomyces frigidus]|nr:hypothetical protein LTR85_010498 [Meristemomyces frigidus]